MKTKPAKDPAHDERVERAARGFDRDAIVVANAGAGKTYLLVERYFALLESGLEPRQIVAFTFTEKAANELKERIAGRLRTHPGFKDLPEELLQGWRTKILGAPIGTIHQYCLKLIEAARGAGEGSAFKIVDEALEQALQETLLRGFLRRRFEAEDPDALLLLSRFGIGDLIKILDRYLGFLPFETEGRTRLPAPEAEEAGLLAAVERLGIPLWEEIQAEKAARRWMSFADMERRALELLRTAPESLRAFLRPVEHLLVDEFQDTAPIQIRLIEALRALARGEKRPLRLFCVGDPKQSIYRFRDVDRNLLRDTEAHILSAGGEKFDFVVNFRSTPAVLELVNAYARSAFPEAQNSQARREDVPGGRVALLQPEEEDEEISWAEREARAVADQISSHDPAVPLDRLAVLYRTARSAEALLNELRARGIPYSVRGGQSLFQRQEIFDLQRLVYFLADPNDDLSLVGILRSPLFLLSDAALYFLTLNHAEESLWRHLILPETLTKLAERLPAEAEKAAWAIRRLERFLVLAETLSAHRLLERWLRREDWGGLYARAAGEVQSLLALEQWLDWLKNLETDDAPLTLQETARLLKEVSALAPNKTPLGDLIAARGSVQLLTIHAAKGLQFDTVFLIGMNRRTKGDYPLLQRVGDSLALKLPEGPGEKRKTERYQAIESYHDAEDREEARRLLYVALTRAENRLVVLLEPKKAAGGTLQDLLLRALQEAADRWKAPWPRPARPTTGELPPRGFILDADSVAPAPQSYGLRETSVSELETLTVCPLKHHWAYQLKQPSRTAGLEEKLDPTEIGTLLHRALNLMHRAPAKGPREALAELLAEAGLEMSGADLEPMLETLQGYRDSRAYAELRNAQEDYSELPFLLRLSAAGLRGQIDRLIRTEQGWVLIDFKYSGRAHSARELLQAYGFQLKTYALAAQRLLRETLHSVQIHVLNRAESHEFRFDAAELRTHQADLDRLTASLAAAPADLSAVRWREACTSCPYHLEVPLCPVPKGRSYREY